MNFEAIVFGILIWSVLWVMFVRKPKAKKEYVPHGCLSWAEISNGMKIKISPQSCYQGYLPSAYANMVGVVEDYGSDYFVLNCRTSILVCNRQKTHGTRIFYEKV